MLEVGELQVRYLKNGSPRYQLEMAHDGLKRHKVIKGEDQHVVLQKARLEEERWAQAWEKQRARDAAKREREATRRRQAELKDEALDRTREAQEALDSLGRLLHATLEIDDTIDWSSLEDHSDFPEPAPTEPGQPGGRVLREMPTAPDPNASAYNPQLGLLDRLLKSRGERKRTEARAKLAAARERWRQEIEVTNAENTAAIEAFNSDCAEWETRRDMWLAEQVTRNGAVRSERDAYLRGESVAIEEYCDLVLSNSQYPDAIALEHDLQYVQDTKTLLTELQLPSLDDLPTLREVRYVQARDEFDEKHLSDAQVRKLYDSVLYQICLRTIHELLEADAIGALDAVGVNGNVTSVDRATGKSVTACILSIQVSKPEFLEINLAAVDPKACFKSLKGVGSSKLHSLTPVAPIMQFRREDGRFVSAREVANTLDEAVNLAAMDWEDFEHLIRELFEQEFKAAGGEVSVTQASRDGGVDAIAYDPDPIRGGKIVIQAKRYTNTVGVAAVRDLYGTVMNEGATKGILVTTSDYGPDAYGFAKDKPISLLSGSNLLHLLQKHGHSARIDVNEAKKLLSDGA